MIRETRADIVIRDRRCRVCGGAFGWGEATAEMHELVPRSRLRGRPPEEIFTRENCVLLHRRCHRDVTAHRVRLSVDQTRGADGPLRVEQTPLVRGGGKNYQGAESEKGGQ